MASGAVLVDELSSIVGYHHRCKRCGCEKDSLGEIHFEKDSGEVKRDCESM